MAEIVKTLTTIETIFEVHSMDLGLPITDKILLQIFVLNGSSPSYSLSRYPIGPVPPLSVVKLLRTEREKGGRLRPRRLLRIEPLFAERARGFVS